MVKEDLLYGSRLDLKIFRKKKKTKHSYASLEPSKYAN